jgi:hypothetical protein
MSEVSSAFEFGIPPKMRVCKTEYLQKCAVAELWFAKVDASIESRIYKAHIFLKDSVFKIYAVIDSTKNHAKLGRKKELPIFFKEI